MDIASIVIIAFITIIYNNDVSNANIKLAIGENRTVVPGSNIGISCGLDCVDKSSFFVSWFFQATNKPNHHLIQNFSCESERIYNPRPNVFGPSDISTIHYIHNITANDEGFYSCKVENQTISSIKTSYINIVKPDNQSALAICIGILCAVVILFILILLFYFYILKRKRTVRPYYVLS
jgi:hypothetical protein